MEMIFAPYCSDKFAARDQYITQPCAAWHTVCILNAYLRCKIESISSSDSINKILVGVSYYIF